MGGPLRTASRTLLALLLTVAAWAAPAGGALGAPGAEPAWAPAGEAAITPGVRVFTEDAQCTANFVYYDDDDVYIGQAAHCATTGGPTDVDGCEADSRPLGTPVEVEGAVRRGRLAYSSWRAMRRAGEDDPDACRLNDFALVRLHPADRGRVNPSVPVYGGPVALAEEAPSSGEAVYSYGNSSLLGGVDLLNAKRGVSFGAAGGGWVHTVVTVIPGVPGDSGSGYVDSEGRAFGVVRTLGPGPLFGSNGVTDLGRALAYMAGHSDLEVALAPGTEPFSADPAARPAPAPEQPATAPARRPRSLLARLVDWLTDLLG